MNTTIHEPAREIPVLGKYDVVVCGGGSAGCAAAIAAARSGARTLLIERLAQMGGLGTSGLVCHWLGGRTNDTRHWVVGGIFRELVAAAVAEGIAVLPQAGEFADTPYTPYGQLKGGLLAGVPVDPFAMTCLLERTLQDAGVEMLLQCQVLGGVVADDRVQTLRVVGKSGLFAVTARAVVDATGDADVAAQCGCGFAQGDEIDGDIAGVSFMLQLERVDERRFMDAIIAEDDPRHEKRIMALRARGDFPFPVNIFVFVKLNAEGRFMVNGNWAPAEDATDPRWRTKILLELRGRIPHLLRLFRANFPGLERCELRAFAADLGVRETRRIHGLARLTVAEVQAGAPCPDTIGLTAYGWDLAGSKNAGQPMHGQAKPPVVPIPYGIMVPRALANVICPGRAVSVERQVLGPLRVIAPVMAMGEAAGVAAALVAQSKVAFANVNMATLQTTLCAQGAILDWEA
jgi:glycine/D-amino acid oxidase-like deaminating enzyme